MFVQYFTDVMVPLAEVDARLGGLFTKMNGWAEGSYREGEALRTRIGVGGDEGHLVAKTVTLEVGTPVRNEHVIRVPMTWRASGTPGLFPRMKAELILAEVAENLTLVKLQGSYEPPLGAVGRFLDRTALHRVAEISVKHFVDQIAAALTVEASAQP